MKVVNLTPHPIVIKQDGGTRTILPSGTVARVGTKTVPAGEFDGIPLFKTEFGEVNNLPQQEAGTIYIVSALVKQRLPDRADVASPGDLIRDEAGAVIGCKGLNI